jgi:hypothetical protein
MYELHRPTSPPKVTPPFSLNSSFPSHQASHRRPTKGESRAGGAPPLQVIFVVLTDMLSTFFGASNCHIIIITIEPYLRFGSFD